MRVNYPLPYGRGFLLHWQPAVPQTGLNSGGPRPTASAWHSPSALQNTGLPSVTCEEDRGQVLQYNIISVIFMHGQTAEDRIPGCSLSYNLQRECKRENISG